MHISVEEGLEYLNIYFYEGKTIFKGRKETPRVITIAQNDSPICPVTIFKHLLIAHIENFHMEKPLGFIFTKHYLGARHVDLGTLGDRFKKAFLKWAKTAGYYDEYKDQNVTFGSLRVAGMCAAKQMHMTAREITKITQHKIKALKVDNLAKNTTLVKVYLQKDKKRVAKEFSYKFGALAKVAFQKHFEEKTRDAAIKKYKNTRNRMGGTHEGIHTDPEDNEDNLTGDSEDEPIEYATQGTLPKTPHDPLLKHRAYRVFKDNPQMNDLKGMSECWTDKQLSGMFA